MKHFIHAAVIAGMTLASTAVLADDLKAAPEFKAKDANGKEHSLADYKGKVLVLEFTNPGSPVSGKGGCPFMVPRYEKQVMQKVADKVSALGGTYLAVNSNNYNTAEDSKEIAKKYDVKFDTLLDSDGTIGKAIGAKTTPHMFVINKEGKIVYDGALNDNASPDITKDETATNYVVQAVEAASKGEVPKVTQTKSYGCGIKYKE